MKQLVIAPGQIQGDIIQLEPQQESYLLKVRRMQAGQGLKILIAGGGQENALLQHSQDGGYHLVMDSTVQEDSHQGPGSKNKAPELVVYPGWLKSGKMDDMIRSLAEIGVSRISPVLLEHCVASPGERLEKKIARWQRIVREATQQSGRSQVPEVRPILSLKALLEDGKNQPINLFFHQNPLAKASLHGYLSAYSPEIGLLIGPEGGLSTQEVESLQEQNWYPVHLPMPVLRAETAALVAAASVQIISQERESWKTQESQE